jgi:hypothetical protein
MLSSYRIACPDEKCGWSGSLVPSRTAGGAGAEAAEEQRVWFQCPQCGRDWEARLRGDRIVPLATSHNGE